MLQAAGACSRHALLSRAATQGGLHAETLGMNCGYNAQAPTGSMDAVLLVEPEQATRQLYAREIGRVWTVVQAASVEAGRRLLRSEAVVAIVLEPFSTSLAGGMEKHSDDLIQDAWDFLREGAARGIPIVVCSVVDERRTAYSQGAALYLLKPLSPQQLVLELQRLLGAASVAIHKEQSG